MTPQDQAQHIAHPQIIKLPRIHDPRGNLTVAQSLKELPFELRRAFWLYDVPAGDSRGGHAHYNEWQFLVATSGSFDVNITDGKPGSSWQKFTLNRPYEGLIIPPGYWRTLDNFSSGAVCLCLVSTQYDEADYIRDFDEFCRIVSEKK